MNEFQSAVWEYYKNHARDLPWRQPEPDGSFDPYKILVSEIMLQQTQAGRVIPKYNEFLFHFPSLARLSDARLSDVLKAWVGLGYNRRAKYLWESARTAMDKFGGSLPRTPQQLTELPGVGRHTAGAVAAYAYNQPVAFIETNIRTVYLHHFFDGEEGVGDARIIEKVIETMVRERPREWFWALMDYGSFLKKTSGNHLARSKSYAKQSKFAGSTRQVRGAVIRMLAEQERTELQLRLAIDDLRLTKVLEDLCAEQLIVRSGKKFHLA